MPRTARYAPGGLVYHALNRAVARLPLFQKDGDFDAFERILAEALQKHPTRLLAYCLMPNHWHMVLWPRKDHELTAFVRWPTHTHSMRWHAHYHSGGTGHIYQGRFKSFPLEMDDHLYTVLRYVERNALRRTSSAVRRRGAGAAYGGVNKARWRGGRRCTRGRRPCRATGWGGSTRRRRRRN